MDELSRVSGAARLDEEFGSFVAEMYKDIPGGAVVIVSESSLADAK